MSEPTKALLVVLAIILIPIIGYVLFIFFKERSVFKNAIHVDFKKNKGKVKGYVKDNQGKWKHDEDLHLEDDADLKNED
ncbi:MAG TPA: hypothetical protein VGK39_00460 [Cyclobacteriaceae bacterium]